MRVIKLEPGASHPVELKAEIDAQRAGQTFLAVRDGQQRQQLFVLEPQDDVVWVGRGGACQVRIDWDEEASRCHAELRRVPGGWAIVDDGLSRNGTFVGGERVAGRRRLRDRDVIRCANSLLTYRLPNPAGAATRTALDVPAVPDLTPAQSRVLVSLCRPLFGQGPAVPPATPRYRGRARLVDRGDQVPHANAVHEIRGRRPASKSEARPARRAGDERRPGVSARPATVARLPTATAGVVSTITWVPSPERVLDRS